MNKIRTVLELEAGSRYCLECRFLRFQRHTGWICLVYQKRPLDSKRGLLRLARCIKEKEK